jgi:hypothetical protein
MGGAVARPKYMGEMLNGQRHGQGRMVWSDGRKYDGAFVKGAREGFGTLELANGDRYEGEWQYDQMHGKGKYTSADGQYNGFWADGLREGKVIRISACHLLLRASMLRPDAHNVSVTMNAGQAHSRIRHRVRG